MKRVGRRPGGKPSITLCFGILAPAGDRRSIPVLCVVRAEDNPSPGVDGLTPGRVSVAVGGGNVVLWGLGCQGQGNKGALTLGLKSWECFDGC